MYVTPSLAKDLWPPVRPAFWVGTSPRRHGNILILFALLVFVLFAVAALVIDLGFALVTRTEMQSAVDTAALEGLRKRDDPRIAADQREQTRRQAASNMVAMAFDEDVNQRLRDNVEVGAGPVLDLTPGVGPANAFQTVSPGKPPVYLPQRHDGTPGLELNLPNETQGDMVAGTFGLNSSFPADALSNEASNYLRRDFTVSQANTRANAFLVRMRRTNNRQGDDDMAAVSSHGPPIPLLFGRGSLIGSNPAGGEPGLRESGVTVRATAIADAGPAMSVGVPNQALDLLGVSPFAFTQGFWAGFKPGSSVTIQVFNQAVLVGNKPVGQLLTPSLLSIGQVPSPGDPATYQQFLLQGRYVPILADTGPLLGRIIGFGFIQAVLLSGNQIQVTMQANQVASENASAVLVNPLDPAISADQLLQAQQSLSAFLLAPTLVR